MDDPDWAWPAWKFGMRRDDLFTTLHDRYNTFTFTLQDPEAFHHDVYEISRDADTADQFHRLMADRQQLRRRELNESLDTLAVEIIANPKLMASEQWQHALQLFRTKSYDSIVRYFASYLPEEYLDRYESRSTSSCSSFSEVDSVHTMSTKANSADQTHCDLFLDDEFFPDGPVVTIEPRELKDDPHHHCSGDAPSPSRSEAMNSESSVSSDADTRSYSSTNPPSRSMSFSGSESGHIVSELMRHSMSRRDNDETSLRDDCDDAHASPCSLDKMRPSHHDLEEACDDIPASSCSSSVCDDDDFPSAQYPDDQFDCLDTLNSAGDVIESDTPTPRQESTLTIGTSCYLDYTPMRARRVSPSRQSLSSPKIHLSRREPGIQGQEVRRSPEEALSRVQKPTPDPLRKRPRGRRRFD
ncbi:hypothetical protein HIM_04565 [Hirsutella minnesotensis 3608]|uniref:Uncharacterized protein n=1 Tax=Hirsutella minnesotensis 3608 TaxID=1043627 RepID=A0A0F8A5X9_9HYPO|nr:hypothetical protein HIM_04565 [Hirsutella minnesotensis 3608]